MSAHELLDQKRLEAWLVAHVPGFAGLAAMEKFAGGQSNPTYRISDGRRDYVLRRKPFGVLLPSAHAVEREYSLIGALWPTGFPVPQPFALCEDAEVIGASFYVMDMVVGRTFWNGALPDAPREERRDIYAAMVGALARLHTIDPQQVGLGDFAPPGNYFERQVKRWTKQYRASQTEAIDAVEKLIEWLPTRLPAQQDVSIIHGDYRIDNMIFAPDRPEVLAVLDWELATLGDPLADFSYLAINWAMPADDRRAQLGGLDFDALNIPTLEDVTRQYCEQTQRRDVPDFNWYFAYNLFRLVGILQGVKKRFIDGNASGTDAEAVSSRIAPMAERAWDFAQRAGAPR